MGTLRDQMQADLQLKGITPRTQKDYLREVSNLAKYFNKSPEELGEKEVREDWLFEGQKKNEHLSISSIRQVFLDAKKRAGITKPASVLA